MTLGDRAERLGVLLSVAEWLPEGTAAAMKQLSVEDLDAIADLDADDLALANACYAVQADLRARGFAAVAELGRLIGRSPEPGGELGERVLALPEPDVFAAIRHTLDLGWID